MRFRFFWRYFIVISLFFVSCKKNESNYTLQINKLRESFYSTSQILHQKAQVSINELSNDIHFLNFVVQQYAIDSCRASWKRAYNDFILLAPYRIGEIANDGFLQNSNYLDLTGINYSNIDYTATTPFSGIIWDTINFPIISESLLLNQNLLNGVNNITCGYHVLEFLLWGEDLSLTSAGNRPYTDFLNNSTIRTRRKQFLISTKNNLQDKFSKIKFDVSYKSKLDKFQSKNFYNELASVINLFIENDIIENTINKSLKSGNSKFELSDFSDNSIKNIAAKIKALSLIFDSKELYNEDSSIGLYTLSDLLSEIDNGKMEKIKTQFTSIDTELKKLENIDFDFAITNENHKTQLNNIISSLREINNTLKSINF